MHCPWANDLPFPKDPQNKVEVDNWETLEDPHAKNHPKSSAEPKPKHKGKVKDYSFQLPVRRRLMRKKYQVDVYDYFNWSPISFGVLSKYPFRLWCRMKGTTFRVSSPFDQLLWEAIVDRSIIYCDIITEFVFGVQLHHSVLVGTALASRTARTSRALEEQSAKKDAWKDVRNIIVIPKCVYLKRDRRRFHWKLLSFFFFNLLIELRSLFQIKVSTWPVQAYLSLKKIWCVQRVRGINPHI